MNLYEKKIVYLHRTKGDGTVENCGFASFQCIPGGYKLAVQLRPLQRTAGEMKISEEIKEEVSVYLGMAEEDRDNTAAGGAIAGRQIEIGKLSVRCSSGNGMFRFPGNQDEIRINNNRYAVSKATGIRIIRYDGWEAAGSFGQEKTDGDGFCKEDLILMPDKWEQLKKQYEILHPFGDEREFISIRPADFVIMTQQYQKLVHNSFLLHGYFNYRHLILGRDTGSFGNGDICFCLGVPGVFYEREKMVAIMFGFEGFETEGKVEDGKFGYYLRKVEI
mgnify:FL=1